MWSTPAVWKLYNKMAVLHFFQVNFTLCILFVLDWSDVLVILLFIGWVGEHPQGTKEYVPQIKCFNEN